MTNAIFLSIAILTNYTPAAQVTVTNIQPNHWYDLQNSESVNSWTNAGNSYFLSNTNYVSVVYFYDYRTYNKQFYRVIDQAPL